MNNTNTSASTGNSPSSKALTGVERAALADPDAKPLAEPDFRRMRRTPQVKVIRRALDLTQQEFAERFHMPLGTLRDWEQGRVVPDQPARAFLRLIAHDPEHVRRALSESELASRAV